MQNILGALPFNISLLILKPESLKGLNRIKVLDIFEPSSSNFHPDGLFSTEAFGKVGDDRRNKRFAYIDLGIEIFHPVIYKELLNIRALYGEIIAGTAYAVFNKDTNDFDPATIATGRTGFEFFLEYFPKLKFEERDSTSRSSKIQLINKHRKTAMLRQLIVMPAGLRDFTVTPSGKSEEDEINTLYRQVLSISNVVTSSKNQSDLTYMDSARNRLQQAVQAIYTYIIGLLEGDSKLIQSWWTNRNVSTSSRNVITSSVSKSKRLFDELTLSPNDVVVGLYQYLMSTLPISVNLIRTFTQQIFTGMNSPAMLVDAKTLKRTMVQVSPSNYDTWVTQEGLERVIGHFESEARRSEVIKVEGQYLALVYRDKKHVKIFHDIDELPAEFDRKNVTPITYAELYYYAVAQRARELYCFTTRYPVINLGGVYVGSIYLKTTTRSQSLVMLDDHWKPSSVILNEFPILTSPYVNSMSPASQHIAAAGADYDGDMMSFIVAMANESIEEIKHLLTTANYYVNIHGEMNYSANDDISDLIFKEMSAA